MTDADYLNAIPSLAVDGLAVLVIRTEATLGQALLGYRR